MVYENCKIRDTSYQLQLAITSNYKFYDYNIRYYKTIFLIHFNLNDLKITCSKFDHNTFNFTEK